MNSRRKSGQGGARQHASRPEASPLDFVIRPQSKIDPEQIRARAKQVVQDQRRLKVLSLPTRLAVFASMLHCWQVLPCHVSYAINHSCLSCRWTRNCSSWKHQRRKTFRRQNSVLKGVEWSSTCKISTSKHFEVLAWLHPQRHCKAVSALGHGSSIKYPTSIGERMV